jgi:hypothetical protein
MDDCWREFDVAVARWRLGEVEIERLPDAAIDALTGGCDSPSLRLLAAYKGSSWSEIGPVVSRVLDERGQLLPTEDEALKSVADSLLQRLTAQNLTPEAATLRLNPLAWRAMGRPAEEDLTAFVGLAHVWDDADAGRIDRMALIARINGSAREILARGGVRAR